MRLSINQARRACTAAGAKQVVLVAFDGSGKYAVTSYGESREECAGVRPLCDAIADGLASRALPAPVVFR